MLILTTLLTHCCNILLIRIIKLVYFPSLSLSFATSFSLIDKVIDGVSWYFAIRFIFVFAKLLLQRSLIELAFSHQLNDSAKNFFSSIAFTLREKSMEIEARDFMSVNDDNNIHRLYGGGVWNIERRKHNNKNWFRQELMCMLLLESIYVIFMPNGPYTNTISIHCFHLFDFHILGNLFFPL